MKKISILTFTFSILLLLGVSCSIVDESLFLETSIETSIEKSPINNNHVFVKDTVLTDDLLKFKHMTDSIALSSPYLAKIDTVYNQSKKINTRYLQYGNVITGADPNRNITYINIPVANGEIYYAAKADSRGIPMSEIHFITTETIDFEDYFIAKIKTNYIQIEGYVKLYKTFLGFNTGTVTQNYIIFVNQPEASIRETTNEK